MLQDFMGHCSPCAIFYKVESLNQLVNPSGTSEDEPTELGELIVDPRPDVEELLHSADIANHVRHFVAGLSPHLRCIALRHYWQGQTHVEIARDLGVTRTAITHAIARIRKLGFTRLSPVVAQ